MSESDRLTVEQVQHAIERHFGKVAVLDDGGPVEWRDDWVCKVGIDYRGIADELNAELGSTDDDGWPSEDSFAAHLLGVTARQDERIAELEALVRDMYRCIAHANEQDWFHFEKDVSGCGLSCTVNGENCGLASLANRMRELGVML